MFNEVENEKILKNNKKLYYLTNITCIVSALGLSLGFVTGSLLSVFSSFKHDKLLSKYEIDPIIIETINSQES